jgi:hypothetical protein
MKRSELVEKLMGEGFSEKTLVNFSDKQLNGLAERILGEQVTTVPGKPSYKVGEDGGSLPPSPKGYKITKDPVDKSTIAQPVESEVKEELKGKQKNLDKNHNGKIDGQDFKILKGQKKEKKKEGVDIKEWVGALAEENFHSFTSKNEIMELIKVKLNESEVSSEPKVPEFMSYSSIKSSGPAVAPSKPKTSPGTKPGTSPGKPKPRTPYEPGIGPKHKPKAYGLKDVLIAVGYVLGFLLMWFSLMLGIALLTDG